MPFIKTSKSDKIDNRQYSSDNSKSQISSDNNGEGKHKEGNQKFASQQQSNQSTANNGLLCIQLTVSTLAVISIVLLVVVFVREIRMQFEIRGRQPQPQPQPQFDTDRAMIENANSIQSQLMQIFAFPQTLQKLSLLGVEKEVNEVELKRLFDRMIMTMIRKRKKAKRRNRLTKTPGDIGDADKNAMIRLIAAGANRQRLIAFGAPASLLESVGYFLTENNLIENRHRHHRHRHHRHHRHYQHRRNGDTQNNQMPSSTSSSSSFSSSSSSMSSSSLGSLSAGSKPAS